MTTKRLYTLLILLLGAVLTGIFIGGNISMFILSYIFIFVFMMVRCLYAAATLHTRLLYIFIYAIIMVLQILFTTLLTFNYEHNVVIFTFFKLISTLIILISLIIEKLLFAKHDKAFFMPSVQDFTVITYAQLIHDKDKIMDTIHTAQKAGHALSKENLSKAFSSLPNHKFFRYISNGNLTNEYFDSAFASLNDEHVYIVLTDSGSAASEIISVFTQRKFNHVSLSFDSDLQTIISYNGGENASPPGMNLEMIECFHKKADSSIMVYRLKTTREQKLKMIEKIKMINSEGSAYNLLGLVFKFSAKPNIMFCSQFVYQMLQYAGLAYFSKRTADVRPSDLVELDYHRKLEFVCEIKLSECTLSI